MTSYSCVGSSLARIGTNPSVELKWNLNDDWIELKLIATFCGIYVALFLDFGRRFKFDQDFLYLNLSARLSIGQLVDWWKFFITSWISMKELIERKTWKIEFVNIYE